MFKLTPAHEAAFRLGQRAAFIEDLAVASYDSLPDDAPFLDQSGRLHGAELVLRQAEARGYSTKGGLFFWLNLATIFGAQFHSDPQHTALRPPQRRVGEPQELDALSAVYDEVSAYISAVHGGTSNSKYTDAALRFADQFNGGAGKPQLENDTDDVARRLAEIYPQKFQRHSSIYLQRLRSGIYKEKAEKVLACHGAADVLFVAGVEMFFGHQFETDAFKPWIGTALEKSKPKNGNAEPNLQEFFDLFTQWVDPD